MQPPEALQSWAGLVLTMLGIGGMTVASVRWVVRLEIRQTVRDEVRSVLDREFKNGREASDPRYQPLRAAVDEIKVEVSRAVALLASHRHEQGGEVMAPIVAREQERV